MGQIQEPSCPVIPRLWYWEHLSLPASDPHSLKVERALYEKSKSRALDFMSQHNFITSFSFCSYSSFESKCLCLGNHFLVTGCFLGKIWSFKWESLWKGSPFLSLCEEAEAHRDSKHCMRQLPLAQPLSLPTPGPPPFAPHTTPSWAAAHLPC